MNNEIFNWHSFMTFMKQKNTRKKNAGFTLLEIMITIAIVGIALVGIIRALAMSVDVCNKSRNISIATLLAKGKMAETESRGFPDVEEITGDFGEEYPGFKWERSISEIGIEGLRKVTVRVLWQEGESEEIVEMLTLISNR